MKLLTLFITLVVAIMAPIAILAGCDIDTACAPPIGAPKPALNKLPDSFLYNVYSNSYFAVYFLAAFFALLFVAYLFFKKDIVRFKSFIAPLAVIFAGYLVALAAMIYSVWRIRFAIDDQFDFWKYATFGYSGRFSLFWPAAGLVLILLAEFIILKLQFSEMAKGGIIKTKAGGYKVGLLIITGLAATIAVWFFLFLIFKTIGIYNMKISD